MANLLAFPFATIAYWRVLYAVPPLLSSVQILLSPLLLESPKWLLSKYPNSFEARVILKQLDVRCTSEEAENRARHILFGTPF